jgi:hypothetical protein
MRLERDTSLWPEGFMGIMVLGTQAASLSFKSAGN